MRALLRLASLASVLALAGCGEDADPRVGACMDYCELVMRNCQGNVAQFTDSSACMATCQAMPLGDPLSPTGNSISCRTFHAALAEDPTRNVCTHAGPGGDDSCGGNCESFCAAAGELCPDVYGGQDSCLSACAGFSTAEVYDASDIGGDTFACRLYHLTAASTDPDTHCPHIAALSVTCL